MELTKGSVYAVRADGTQLIFDSVDDQGYPYGFLRNPNGKSSTVGLFDKWTKVGEWTVAKDFVELPDVVKSVFIVPPLQFIKHLAGQHDQSSHGNWANGGPIAEGEYGQWGAERQRMILKMKDKGPSMAYLARIRELSDNSVPIGDRAKDWVEARNNVHWQIQLQNYLDSKSVDHGGDSLITEQLTDDFYNTYGPRILLDASSELENSLLSKWKEVYNIDYNFTYSNGLDDQIKSRVNYLSIDTNDGSINVSGGLFNQYDDQVGEFERTIYTETNMVEHDLLNIWDSNYQGTGFGSVFLNQSENYYISHGIKGINVSTAWVGGYVWPRMGFDWSPSHPEDHREIKNRLKDHLFVIDDTPANKPYRDEIQTMITRLEGNPLDSSFPTPYDISMLGFGNGRDKDGNVLTSWFGKRLLANNQKLHYQKRLDVKPRQIIAPK